MWPSAMPKHRLGLVCLFLSSTQMVEPGVGVLLCCAAGRVDLGDPATRAAYVHARRHPDVRSARAQLAEHYARLWRAER